MDSLGRAKGSQPGSDVMVIPPSTIGTSVRARSTTAGFSGEQTEADGRSVVGSSRCSNQKQKNRGGGLATFALNQAYRYQT
jgi:hypothetical protein